MVFHILISLALTVVSAQNAVSDFNPFSTTTTTTNPGQQDSYGITRYNCRTLTCGLYEQDEWIPVNSENATRDCHAAIEEEYAAFEADYVDECKYVYELRLSGWVDVPKDGDDPGRDGCRKRYCQMFQNVLDRARPNKNQYYYQSCAPILHFNYSLCLTEYRDADAVCGCLCHGMHLINYNAGCFSQYMKHVFFGRRGFEHLAPTAICTLDLCGIFSSLADPRVMKTLEGVPPTCKSLNLPFDRQNCAALINDRPYDPCPWETKTAPVDHLMCTDGSYCSVSGEGSWACCSGTKGGRMLCPENYPFMCAEPLKCVGSSDYCCVQREEDCWPGGVRTCSLILNPVLPEWFGVSYQNPDEKSPEELAKLYPDKYGEAALYKIKMDALTKPPKKEKPIQQDTDLTLYVAIGGGAACLVLLAVIMVRVCGITFSEVAKTDNVFTKNLSNCSGDPVAQYKPSKDMEHQKALKKDPRWVKERVLQSNLPGSIDEETGKGKASLKKKETAAFQQLRRLTMKIRKHGSISGVAEQQELEEAIELAEAQIGSKMDPDDGGGLIAQGRKQLAILAQERQLNAITKATDRDVVAQAADYRPAEIARPGGKNVTEIEQARAQQDEAWQRLDTLRLAAFDAQTVGANPVLVDRADARVAQFVGRTVELPQERVVLDPEGKGLKLLQPGMQRATDRYSGESYAWDVSSYSACYVVRDRLGEVDTDAAQPLCASFVKNGHCSLGQRCAWRHASQQPGDRIREPIQPRDS